MRRLRIFTWNIRGSYLYYLHSGHDFYVPRKFDRSEGFIGITDGYPWSSNLHEVPVDRIKEQQFDTVLYQSRKNYLEDAIDILSGEQLRLPSIYLEHDPPRESPTDSKHPADDPNILVVHVTAFNKRMWDCGRSPSIIIEHGALEWGQSAEKTAIDRFNIDRFADDWNKAFAFVTNTEHKTGAHA